MKILSVEIGGFGRLRDFSAETGQGLNLVFGMNESGKSTLLAFIKACIYGLSEEKKQRYRPWSGGPFGGALRYALDDGSIFRVMRDFETGYMLFEDSAGNLAASKDPATQLGMDEALFSATVCMEQGKPDPDPAAVLSLYEKFSDKAMPEGPELEKALVYLSRSRERAGVKSLEEEYTSLTAKASLLSQETGNGQDTAEDAQTLSRKLEMIGRSYEEMLKAAGKLKLLKKESGNVSERPEALSKLTEMKSRQAKLLSTGSVFLIPFYILCITAAALGVLSFVYSRQDLFYISGGVLALSLVMLVLEMSVRRGRKQKLKKLDEEIGVEATLLGIDPEASLNSMLFARKKQAEPIETEEELEETVSLKFAVIKLNADRDIAAAEDVPEYMKALEERIRLLPQTANTSMLQLKAVEERLALVKMQLDEAHEADSAIIAAINALSAAGRDKGKSAGIASMTGTIAAAVTSGRYSRTEAGKDGIYGGSSEKGDLASAAELSTGTAGQLAFAFRLAAAKALSAAGESLPVFLDEPFAFFDERRIYESMKYLIGEAADMQMFFFTCRKSEASAIKALAGESLNILRLKV